MSYEDSCELYHSCLEQKYGFVVIDKNSALIDGWYRKRLNDFAIL